MCTADFIQRAVGKSIREMFHNGSVIGWKPYPIPTGIEVRESNYGDTSLYI